MCRDLENKRYKLNFFHQESWKQFQTLAGNKILPAHETSIYGKNYIYVEKNYFKFFLFRLFYDSIRS